jgi:hypothetical protein
MDFPSACGLLLRTHRERPRNRAAEQRDELAASQFIGSATGTIPNFLEQARHLGMIADGRSGRNYGGGSGVTSGDVKPSRRLKTS